MKKNKEPAEQPEKETELDKYFALIFKIFLKFLNMLIINSLVWTLAFENALHLTQDFLLNSFLKTVQNTDLSNFDGSL